MPRWPSQPEPRPRQRLAPCDRDPGCGGRHIVFDPAIHCGAARRQGDDNGCGRKGDPCTKRKGARTDHLGSGHCRSHLGTSPNGEIRAAKERSATYLARQMGWEPPPEIDGREAIAELVSLRATELNECAKARREALDRGDAEAALALARRFDALRREWLVESKADADVRIEGTKAEAALRLSDAEMLRSLFLGSLEAMAARVQLPTPFLDRIQPPAAREQFEVVMRQVRAAALDAGRAHAITGLQALSVSMAGGVQ